MTSSGPMKSQVDLNKMTIELPGDERIRVNAVFPDYKKYQNKEGQLIGDLFLEGIKVSGDDDFLGWKSTAEEEYQWISYNKVYERAYHIGCGLKELGYGRGTLIGVCARNRPEWVMIEQGFHMFSLILITMHETLGVPALKHIYKQTDLPVLFCDSQKAELLLGASLENRRLKVIVTLEEVTDSQVIETCHNEKIRLMTLQDLEKLGANRNYEKELPQTDDTAVICYTSGTTGDAKGVMLSHRAITATVDMALMWLTTCGLTLTKDDVTISYLPLAHMLEKFVEYSVMKVGGKIGYFRGNVKELVQDIQALRPTVLPSVPRVLNSLYNKVQVAVAESRLKSMLFNFAVSRKFEGVKSGYIGKDSIWDKLFFRKVQDLLGGRVRLAFSGSAPISAEVLKFLKSVLGCQVLEGYGLTEVTAAIACTSCYDMTAGHVGPPVPGCEVKLVDIPEMEYFSENNEGEVYLRTPSAMKGYFKEKVKTAARIGEDGWIHTGDVGRWLPNGCLQIIQRKKHFVKLCQGQYIAPEKVENVYSQCLFVAQKFCDWKQLTVTVLAYVLRFLSLDEHGVYFGDDLLQNMSCTVAIVVPDEQYVMKWAAKEGKHGSFEELCKDKDVRETIFKSMQETGCNQKLTSLEQVKAIHLTSILLTPKSDLMTPTFKLRRWAVEKHFKKEIDDMYRELSSKPVQKKSIF